MAMKKWAALWTLMRGHRLRYAAAIAALVAASCFLYLAPLIPQIVMDGVISDDAESAPGFVLWSVNLLGGREYLAANLWLCAVLIAILTALAGIFTYLRGRWSAEASEAIVISVRDRVYDHLQRLPCRYFDRAETGDLIQRCTSDVETLRNFLTNQVVEIGRAVIMLAVPLPLMIAIDWRMTIASVILLPIVVGFSLSYFLRVKSIFKEVEVAEGAMTTTIQENLTGIRVVRAFARQEHEMAKFHERSDAYRALDYRLYQLMARFWSISDFLCFAQRSLVVIFGAWLLAVGDLQAGAFYYFLTVVTMFVWPVRMMGRILTDLGKAVVALSRLEEILEETEESAPANPVSPDSLRGDLAFDGVTFTHGGSSPVLNNVSFRVRPGETLGVLGASGSGKSTIVNLLLRLYDYEQGSIRIDDIELRDMERSFIRRHCAVVMQEPFLYSKTIRQNVTLGRPSATEEELTEATRLACIHDSIEAFDGGYDTIVGERGVTLSGGQRQRVALARALLQEPTFLILDDSLSAVDTETEGMILEALRQRSGRQTTVLIAHRLSTIMHADRIIVLDHGRIVEQGSHAELIGAGGLYARLWKVQQSTGEDTDTDRRRGTTVGAETGAGT